MIFSRHEDSRNCRDLTGGQSGAPRGQGPAAWPGRVAPLHRLSSMLNSQGMKYFMIYSKNCNGSEFGIPSVVCLTFQDTGEELRIRDKEKHRVVQRRIQVSYVTLWSACRAILCVCVCVSRH